LILLYAGGCGNALKREIQQSDFTVLASLMFNFFFVLFVANSFFSSP